MSSADDLKKKMTAAIEHLKHELSGIRTGRANPAMVDGIMVDVYGSQMRLRDIASITAPEARQLLIQPFDPQTTSAIGKAIEKANIGIMPIVDANMVRLNIPAMDKNLREKMVKLIHEVREKTKVVIRNLRRDANDAARDKKKAGTMAEDELKKREKEIQELTDKFCKEADDVSAQKEIEVMKI
jgi:ribosome recycling factor